MQKTLSILSMNIMDNPKVYSFFEPIEGWSDDHLLAELWELNWRQKGFDPIILSKSHAEEHPYYEEFCDIILKTFELVMGRAMLSRDHPWDYYVFHNYIRFLAYANVIPAEETSLVMDYDVYNVNYSNHNLNPDSLTFLFSNCPCAVSGTKQQFLSYCEWMANTPLNHVETIKSQLHKGPYTTLHEMALLHHMQKIDPATVKNFNFVNPQKSIVAMVRFNENHKLVHVSNGYLLQYLQTCNINGKSLSFKDKINMRVDIANNILNNIKMK